MSAVRAWVTVICISAVACTMIELMSPSGKMEKMVKFVLGVFMMYALIVPLKGATTKFSLNLKSPQYGLSSNTREFGEKVSEQAKKVAEDNIRRQVEKLLENKGISAKKIAIFMDTKEDNCISIIKIRVYLESRDKNKTSQVGQLIEEKLKIQTDVLIGDDTG